MSDQEPRPLLEQLPEGKHAICTCGQTSNAPFCDGSHAGSGLRPVILDVAPTGQTIAWCTCRDSGNGPMCDGSHKKLWKNPLPPKPPKSDTEGNG